MDPYEATAWQVSTLTRLAAFEDAQLPELTVEATVVDTNLLERYELAASEQEMESADYFREAFLFGRRPGRPSESPPRHSDAPITIHISGEFNNSTINVYPGSQGVVTPLAVAHLRFPNYHEALTALALASLPEVPGGILAARIVAKALEDQVRVPVFGSPPEQWLAIGQALHRLGPTGTALAMTELQKGNAYTFLAYFAAMTVAVQIIQPAAKAFGEVLEARIKQWGLRVPPDGAEPARPRTRGRRPIRGSDR
jgi:hypothetical protein